MIRLSFVLIISLWVSVAAWANNVRINGDVKIVAADVKDGVATIKFSVAWDNSWRDQFNHDGVYVFLKYKKNEANSEWHHVYLMDNGNAVSPDANYALSLSKSTNTANRNEGVFVYPKKIGYFGTAGNTAELTLKWLITSNEEEQLVQKDFEDGKVYVSAMAIEMVYVPRGAYRIGDTKSKYTFQEKYLYIPEKWDVASDAYYTDDQSSTSSVVNPNPAGWAVNHICDIHNSARNAWKGTGLTDQWWRIDFGQKADGSEVTVNKAKTIRYIAIESIPGYVPTTWTFEGTNDLGGGSWDNLYTGAMEEWVTSLVRTYPPTRAIRVNAANKPYRYYRIHIDNMAPSTNPPIIKNIAMTEQDLATPIYDNSVLINDSTTLLSDQSGMHGLYSTDGDSWTGTSSSIYYPNGYEAFWVMKYELSQEQYVAFLNKLNLQQQQNRTVGAALEGMQEGDYVFGKNRAAATCRNGIVLATRGEAGEPLVFANDLNKGDGEFSQDGDGQTLACNFITPADMLAYADWCGLRPLSEMEYEKMSRRPFPEIPSRGEYAWNTQNCTLITGVDDAPLGKKNEKPLGGNVNAGGAVNGPIRCGAFAAIGSGQEGAGASFWGVMDLSGNVSEIYYNINKEGRQFRGIQNQFHGTGKLDVNGNTTLQISEWPRHQEAFTLRGGSFKTKQESGELATSDRTHFKLNRSIEARDSTVGFRLGRTAPARKVETYLTLQNGLTTEVAGRAIDTVCSGEGYVLKGDIPAEVTGAYTIAWYISENDGRTWDLLENENGRDLRIRRLRNENTTADQFKKYRYKRHLYSNSVDAKTDYAEIRVIDLDIRLNRLKDTVDIYNYSAGIQSQALFPVNTMWKYGLDDWKNMLYMTQANKTFLHYMSYNDFKVGGIVQTGDQKLVIRSDFFTDKCSITDTVDVYVKEAPANVTPSKDVVCGDYMLDTRNSKKYKTIKIGTLCWMAENLNYDLDGSLCYNNSEDSCNIYGRLYNWNQANKGGGTSVTPQGICPDGWHLPSNEEWKNMIGALPGTAIKSSTDEWDYVAGKVGTNTTRFSALPGGGKFYSYSGNQNTQAGIASRNTFADARARAWWWTSTVNTANTYWHLANKGLTGMVASIPYYIRLDANGTLVFNQPVGVSSNYNYMQNSIFVGSSTYLHLTGSNNDNSTALKKIQEEFYFSVRCVKDDN